MEYRVDSRVSNIDRLASLFDWLTVEKIGLKLACEQLIFLLAIAFYEPYYDEDELNELVLQEIFCHTYRLIRESAPVNSTQANHAINALVAQRVLTRFYRDHAEGENRTLYRLTPLGLRLAEYYQKQPAFSAEKLSVQLELIASTLQQVADAAEQGGDQPYLQQRVFAPLKYAVAELLDGVDLNQRILDEQQGRVQRTISALLQQSWHVGIANCQALLIETSVIFRELQDTLEKAADGMQAELLRIGAALGRGTPTDTGGAILFQLQTKLDRIVLWGQQAIDLWTGYDRQVHKFIRTAIDLDINRVFACRLRNSIREYFKAPWVLYVTANEKLFDLRDSLDKVSLVPACGVLPETLVYEKIAEQHSVIRSIVTERLQRYRLSKNPLSITTLLQTILLDFTVSEQLIASRLLIEEAMKLGFSTDELLGTLPGWSIINEHGAKVQAHVIDCYF